LLTDDFSFLVIFLMFNNMCVCCRTWLKAEVAIPEGSSAASLFYMDNVPIRQYKSLEMTAGEAVGIACKNGSLRVSKVARRGTAAAAGVRVGDRLASVNGVTVSGIEQVLHPCSHLPLSFQAVA